MSRPVGLLVIERLSASEVDIDDGCSLGSIHSYGLKPFLSFNCRLNTVPFTTVCLLHS